MSAKKPHAGKDEETALDSVEEALVGRSAQEEPVPDPDDERGDGGRDKPPLKSP